MLQPRSPGGEWNHGTHPAPASLSPPGRPVLVPSMQQTWKGGLCFGCYSPGFLVLETRTPPFLRATCLEALNPWRSYRITLQGACPPRGQPAPRVTPLLGHSPRVIPPRAPSHFPHSVPSSQGPRAALFPGSQPQNHISFPKVKASPGPHQGHTLRVTTPPRITLFSGHAIPCWLA